MSYFSRRDAFVDLDILYWRMFFALLCTGMSFQNNTVKEKNKISIKLQYMNTSAVYIIWPKSVELPVTPKKKFTKSILWGQNLPFLASTQYPVTSHSQRQS